MLKITTAIFALAASSAFAMGGGINNPILDHYLDKLDINPVMLSLAKAFKAGQQGLSKTSRTGWHPDLKFNTRYECTVFWVLRDKEAPMPPSNDSEYNFKPMGRLLLENLSVFDNVGNVRWFSEDTISPGDIIGRSEDRSYFESIRVDVDGSLITEVQTRNAYYVKYILHMLGRGDLESSLTVDDFKSRGLALPGVIEQNLGLVLGYVYCPTNAEGLKKVQSLSAGSLAR